MRVASLTAALLLAATRLACADGDAARGEKRFEECAACHALEKGKESVGPDLHGVFGRKVASVEDFVYSPAFRRATFTWTPALLDQYLADPQAGQFRGNRMPFSGMPDAKERADLVAYLVDATK